MTSWLVSACSLWLGSRCSPFSLLAKDMQETESKMAVITSGYHCVCLYISPKWKKQFRKLKKGLLSLYKAQSETYQKWSLLKSSFADAENKHRDKHSKTSLIIVADYFLELHNPPSPPPPPSSHFVSTLPLKLSILSCSGGCQVEGRSVFGVVSYILRPAIQPLYTHLTPWHSPVFTHSVITGPGCWWPEH